MKPNIFYRLIRRLVVGDLRRSAAIPSTKIYRPAARFSVFLYRVFNPTAKRRFASELKTQIAGAIDSVLRYDTFTRILQKLINRISGIPILC